MQTFIKKWEKTRNMGKKAYMLRYGVVYIGFISALAFTVMEIVSYGKVTIPYLGIRLVVFPIIGSMIVGQRWDSREQKYKKLTSGMTTAE